MRVARWLPAGGVVVYRAFGAENALMIAGALRRLTSERGLRLLVGADAGLAARVRADGVHLPERLMPLAPRLRQARPDWLLSTAAHGTAALHRAADLNLDAALVSAVFPSHSASAGPAIGPVRLARLIRGVEIPVVALGGVNARTAPRLLDCGVAGLAAIDGLVPDR